MNWWWWRCMMDDFDDKKVKKISGFSSCGQSIRTSWSHSRHLGGDLLAIGAILDSFFRQVPPFLQPPLSRHHAPNLFIIWLPWLSVRLFHWRWRPTLSWLTGSFRLSIWRWSFRYRQSWAVPASDGEDFTYGRTVSLWTGAHIRHI